MLLQYYPVYIGFMIEKLNKLEELIIVYVIYNQFP